MKDQNVVLQFRQAKANVIMSTRLSAAFIALALAVPSTAAIKPEDRAVGLCTRKDEMLAKLETIDPLIRKLTAAEADDDRDKPASNIARDFGGDAAIECLNRPGCAWRRQGSIIRAA